MTNKTKNFFFKSLVDSVMLYGAEIWTLCGHQANKLLLATEMVIGGEQQGSQERRKLETRKLANYEYPTHRY